MDIDDWDVYISKLTAVNRQVLFVRLIRYMLSSGEVEARTLRSTIKRIEEGHAG